VTDCLRLVVEGRDRVGMTMDVSKVLYENHLNIISMEVYSGLIYVKLLWGSSYIWDELAQALKKVSGVDRVSQTEFLPSEKREQQIKAVLDSISEGIIAIDRNGCVTLINPAAERILEYPVAAVLGKPIQDVLSPDVPVLHTLATGRGRDNEEIMIKTYRGRHHHIITSRPIENERGEVTGAVAVLKDMSQVRDLVYSITRPSMVTFADITAESQVMKNVVDLAKMVAKSQSTVILRGESGTGKELFAKAIHMASPRRHKPFVPVNCAALPDSLLESELFGYEEGAFTGAHKGGKQGLFEFAHRGTLFLDEIGELSPHLQVKFLRVLQDGQVRRIGGKEEFSVDVRIITATNRNLEDMLQKGNFREDLYYRLNVIPLFLPPLRERKEDISVLVESFIGNMNSRLGLSIRGVSREAMKTMMDYPWPGNVRELANVIERGMTLGAGTDILNLPQLLITSRETHGFRPSAGDVSHAEDSWKLSAVPRPLADQIADTEVRALRQALAVHKSSRLVGKALGVSHTTVLKKLRKYGLGKPES